MYALSFWLDRGFCAIHKIGTVEIKKMLFGKEFNGIGLHGTGYYERPQHLYSFEMSKKYLSWILEIVLLSITI